MEVRKFFIKPAIPKPIGAMSEIAFNLWGSWDKDAKRLFHRLDPQLYRNLNHNPVEFLYRLPQEKLIEVSKDKGFLYELSQVVDKFRSYMKFTGTYTIDGEERQFSPDDIVAYICMEYGIHESMPMYSGGLAVLSGDQLKAVSDVGFQMVSFGLLYKYGYFNQHITADGKQIEEYRENAWYLNPITEVADSKGGKLIIEVPIKGEKVLAKLWKIDMGRVPLYLLDTDIPQNSQEVREITDTLYDTDRKVRLKQELLLGRGSVLACRVLGIQPKIYHLNEGHTAFTILERLLELIKEKGFSPEDAKTVVRYSTVFTTHTPVIEGNESFDDELIEEFLKDEVKALGLTMGQFLALGKTKKETTFWLPAYVLRHSSYSNGVSELHAGVSRAMWRGLYPTMHEREVPIDGITNGVHLQSWLSLQMTELFDRYIGPDYAHQAERQDIWDKIATIPDGEIWNVHRRRKEQLISFIRRRIGEMMINRGYGRNKIKDVEKVFNPDSLTIGFARRFAQYKRANLILNNPERLAAILTNDKRPVQIVFAGKAHPADGFGKDIIKQVFDFISDYNVEHHVVFLEDYDINVARHLVQGVDVWLNTPVHFMEASGTSGIKAAINGVLNLSILDGWWPEAYNGENGWAITVGSRGGAAVPAEAEANQIYELLENDITELFYNRPESNLPIEWIRMMKNAISTVCRDFNMHRTVREYLYRCYLPQLEMSQKLMMDDCALLKKLAKLRREIDAIWQNISVRDFFSGVNGRLPVCGERINVECYVYLGDANEGLISAEVFYSFGPAHNEYCVTVLKFVERYQDKVGKFAGELELKGSGLQELSIRIVPSDPDFRKTHPEYIKWKE